MGIDASSIKLVRVEETLQDMVFLCFSFCLIHLHACTEFAVEIKEKVGVVQLAEHLGAVLYRSFFL